MHDQQEEDVAPNALLNLSPELRNHIYGYLLDRIQTSPGVIDYYQITRSERNELTDLRHLLQICRQIRDELLSLLVKGQTIRIYLRHVPAFVESTLCIHFFGPGIPIETPFTIEIELNNLPQSSNTMDVDFDSFLKLVVRRPKVELKFTISGFFKRNYTVSSQEAILRDLGRVLSHPYKNSWKDALNTIIARVELCEMPPARGRGGLLLLVLRRRSEMPSMQSLGITEENMEEAIVGFWGHSPCKCALVRVIAEDE